MSIEFTLLGFLVHGPKTGYELKKLLDESTQFFWHAELSQIYPALKKLEQNGRVVSETQPQHGKPDKKLYSITPAGGEALLAWLADPLDQPPEIKNQVLLKLFFSGMLAKEEICAQLRCQLEVQRALQKRIQQESAGRIRSSTFSGEPAMPARMWEAVRQYGQAQAEMTVRWLEETLSALEQAG
jgi:PadR family transcriptional regulator, regulatory protein AphA